MPAIRLPRRSRREPIFIQGARRSGTTIAFDIFFEDPRFTCWYEPLCAAEDARRRDVGSTARHSVDVLDSVRTARADFAARRPVPGGVAALNHGLPRDASLELDQDSPEHIVEYLRGLLDADRRVVCKEVRLWRKVSVLHDLAPGATLVHAVRDPRSVVGSYVFGRRAVRRDRFPDADAFFSAPAPTVSFGTARLAAAIVEEQGMDLDTLTGVERALLVWGVQTRAVDADGRTFFGDRYRLLRHEDLVREPARAATVLGEVVGTRLDRRSTAWASRWVRPAAEPYAAADPRWVMAIERLDLGDVVEQVGYGALLT
jgi:hypothetical protein